MRAAIVILNWNTREYLQRWLPALVQSCRGLDAAVVVADNASTDGSPELVRERFPEVRMIALEANYGFTGGYNRALAQIEAEYYVLINSDVDVVDGWLEPLLDWMDSHPDCGVCGPKLHALGPGFEHTDRFEYAGAAGGRLTRHGFPWCRGRILSHTSRDRGQYKTCDSLKWVSGACLVTRSALWRELGGLDERFFAHMEEIDYCWRARRRGWKVACVCESTVWHLGGGTLPQGSPHKLKLNFRNSLLMLHTNAPSRLRIRLFMDGIIRLIYLLGGRREAAQAVTLAHKEYKELTK